MENCDLSDYLLTVLMFMAKLYVNDEPTHQLLLGHTAVCQHSSKDTGLWYCCSNTARTEQVRTKYIHPGIITPNEREKGSY